MIIRKGNDSGSYFTMYHREWDSGHMVSSDMSLTYCCVTNHPNIQWLKCPILFAHSCVGSNLDWAQWGGVVLLVAVPRVTHVLQPPMGSLWSRWVWGPQLWWLPLLLDKVTVTSSSELVKLLYSSWRQGGRMGGRQQWWCLAYRISLKIAWNLD